ncbi:glycoside hydrolase family 16 protein [Falsiroseomonas sp. CW058]|uniref:glycoside hydrolase family 16 protein n=1 Tax=Falsiroseomonas sp. CW058 TaxID=3388664 RepID=UPI003D31B36C
MSDFTTVFQDDFSGSRLDTGIWRSQYSGQYGNGMFRWDPGQIEIGGGVLTIATERAGGSWVSGGLSTIPEGQTYGRYEFRARIEEGQGTAGVILLWPSDGQWTDEVDIIETHDPDRDSFAFVNHGSPWTTEYVRTDVDEWHTYALDWTPGNLTLYVDGREVASIDRDVPSQDMAFGIQGHVLGDDESWYGGGPDGSTPDRVEIEVDWVRVSAWTPGEGRDEQEPEADAAEAGRWIAAEADEEAGEWDAAGWSGEAEWNAGETDTAADDAEEDEDPLAAFTTDGEVDWEAVAAQVRANFEETGQWFI